ncbi:MAG: hypothetical protein GEEBNDBF_02307 [bacterium]|nr:hypothetical protein [bacterium]
MTLLRRLLHRKGEQPLFPSTVEEAFGLLYRSYTVRRARRNSWHPLLSFDWHNIDKLDEAELQIVEGFYAVESFVPDYGAKLTALTRTMYGRSHFHMIWAAEEVQHSEAWRNVLKFNNYRTDAELDRLNADLMDREWQLPYDTPIGMILYTVIQERATDVIYREFFHKLAERREDPNYAQRSVVTKVARQIAADETRHYAFFLQGAFAYLFFALEETTATLAEVLKTFRMPATDTIWFYEDFIKQLYGLDVFGRRKYKEEVIDVVFRALTIPVEDFRHYQKTGEVPGGALVPRVAELFGRIVDRAAEEVAQATRDQHPILAIAGKSGS